MAYKFTDTAGHGYKPNAGKFGSIYLGHDQEGREIGIQTERHAITFAGSGGGKGAALLIPNLLRWQDNALVIDPKGSIAAATWEARERMGQKVAILDPFKVADVPDRLRVSINLLDGIDLESLTAYEDIRAIADGNVIRYKAEDGTWDNGAVTVLAGMIAYVMGDENPEGRTLSAVRQLLTLPPETLQQVFEDMSSASANTAQGRMARAAASIGLSPSKKNQEFVGGAVDHTEWLDGEAMRGITKASSFRMSELKTGNASLFLVLPPRMISEHRRFLRLFVRTALNEAMTSLGGRRCLFILDEFFALGHMDQIAVSMGLMRDYNLHIWPFLQDLEQLLSVYGAKAAHTFFANTDAQIFFNLTDAPSLDYVSMRIGALTAEEVATPLEPSDPHGPLSEAMRKYPLPDVTKWWLQEFADGVGGSKKYSTVFRNTETKKVDFLGLETEETTTSVKKVGDQLNTRQSFIEFTKINQAHADALKKAQYDHAMMSVGKPRLPPDELRELIGKKDGDDVARSMVVFGKGNDVFNLPLSPYFRPFIKQAPSIAKPAPPSKPALVDDPRRPLTSYEVYTGERLSPREYAKTKWLEKMAELSTTIDVTHLEPPYEQTGWEKLWTHRHGRKDWVAAHVSLRHLIQVPDTHIDDLPPPDIMLRKWSYIDAMKPGHTAFFIWYWAHPATAKIDFWLAEYETNAQMKTNGPFGFVMRPFIKAKQVELAKKRHQWRELRDAQSTPKPAPKKHTGVRFG